jgi:hypothetical protein
MSTKKDAQPICSCGTRSVHKTFVQFEYDYCPKCKKEVAPGTTTLAPLPFGISALRYEKIITECCNEEVGHLLKDLVSNKSMRTPDNVYFRTMYTGCAQCSLTRDKFERKNTQWTSWGTDATEYSWYIKNRGWV